MGWVARFPRSAGSWLYTFGTTAAAETDRPYSKLQIPRPAASAADPEEKSRTTWFAGVEVVVLKEEFPVCELHEQETTKVFD